MPGCGRGLIMNKRTEGEDQDSFHDVQGRPRRLIQNGTTTWAVDIHIAAKDAQSPSSFPFRFPFPLSHPIFKPPTHRKEI